MLGQAFAANGVFRHQRDRTASNSVTKRCGCGAFTERRSLDQIVGAALSLSAQVMESEEAFAFPVLTKQPRDHSTCFCRC